MGPAHQVSLDFEKIRKWVFFLCLHTCMGAAPAPGTAPLKDRRVGKRSGRGSDGAASLVLRPALSNHNGMR